MSSSSRSPMACTTIVSTLSGENFSLYLLNEWDNPSAIGAMSESVNPPISSLSWYLTPLISSITPLEYTHAIPSFSLIKPPSLGSASASVSPSACFLRNFLRSLPILESTMEAAAANASAVLSNFVKAFMETIFFAPSGVLKASSRACVTGAKGKRQRECCKAKKNHWRNKRPPPRRNPTWTRSVPRACAFWHVERPISRQSRALAKNRSRSRRSRVLAARARAPHASRTPASPNRLSR